MRRAQGWVCLAAMGMLSAASRPESPARVAGAKPSVILVVLDACRADRLSSMGYFRQTTPNLDRLAASGLLFTQHYSGSNGTITGVSQLLSSTLRPLPLISAPGAPPPPDENALTALPAVLADNGYRTALFAGHPYFHPRLAPVTRVFDFYSNVASLKPEGQKANLADVLDQFEPWLAAQHTPFFAYLHAMDTHFPHPLRARAPVFVDRRVRPSFANGAPPEQAANLGSPIERQYVSDLYDEDLHEADRAVGRLIGALSRLGRLENTVLVVTADHGEQLYEAGYAGHGGGIGNLPDTETHIPLVVSFGGELRPQRIDGMTRSIDVAPSILALAGASIPAWMMGNVLIRPNGSRWEFDPQGTSPFAPVFNQDRDPVRVALRFPRMKYFTRWSAAQPVALTGPAADEALVSVGDGDGVIPVDDPRFAEARQAWRRLTAMLSRPVGATDEALKRLRKRLRTLGYVSG
ncbi:MAG: sulfatase [Acidobacteria bacterium]|nr:sulfatase [Acidobacteriota bacterium]